MPTLHFRRIRGGMIMVFKILTGVIDSTVSCNFIHIQKKGEKLSQKQCALILLRFFANRIVRIWNSLPDYVVSACSAEVFEKSLDLFCRNQECMYEAIITGIGNRSVIKSI